MLVLAVVAIVGFVQAGSAILRVRPLARGVGTVVVTAASCSGLAQLALGDGDLWLGVALNLILPVLTVVYLATESESPVAGHRRWRLAGDVIGVAFLAWIAAATVVWPVTRTWGATHA